VAHRASALPSPSSDQAWVRGTASAGPAGGEGRLDPPVPGPQPEKALRGKEGGVRARGTSHHHQGCLKGARRLSLTNSKSRKATGS